MMLSIILVLVANANLGQARQATPEIVVIGERVADARKKLKACLARGCPPNEDIDATLALAETEVLAGDYESARQTLISSLSRNERHGLRYPIPVSDLHRANGKVAASLGFDHDYYRSTWGIFRTLKAGLPDDATRRFSAQIEVAEMMGRTRGHTRARLYYAAIARQARAEGRPDIAALAELRSAMRHLPRWAGKPYIRKIADMHAPETRAAALEAKVALARIAHTENDERTAAELRREFASMNIERPILIFTPNINDADIDLPSVGMDDTRAGVPGNNGGLSASGRDQVAGSPAGSSGIGKGGSWNSGGPRGQNSALTRMSPMVKDIWVDVGFEIDSEGRVTNLRVVRSRGSQRWAKPLLDAIAGRVYTPGKPGSPGSKRLERFKLTSGLEKKSESRQTDHSPRLRIEYLDLSTDGLAAAT